MDKYKTSALGQSLKKVYRGELKVEDSVAMARKEIQAVFAPRQETPETDTDTGLYGDVVGSCPLCGKEVVKGRYGYGCLGYKEGCKFRVNGVICGRVIPISAARALLEKGRTQNLRGFISKNGKAFDAYLRLEEGRAVFAFENERRNSENESN